MIGLEAITGTGVAIFYPASQALLPRLVPRDLLQEASAISRLAMNTGQMSGAAVAGLLVAAAGAGWALLLCGIGMVTTVPLLLSIQGTDRVPVLRLRLRRRACSPNCARAGRSFVRTPGCG